MAKKPSVEERHEAIKALLNKVAVSDQNQLVDLLWKHHGIETNQAVVSRDLRKIGVVKKVIKGELVYEVPTVDVAAGILELALVDIEYNESMILIKTYPGLADFVGDCVDQYNDLDVLGCLSGENVVFVAPLSVKTIKTTYEKICQRFHFKKKGS